MFSDLAQFTKIPATSEKTPGKGGLFQAMLDSEHGNEANELGELLLQTEQNSNNKTAELPNGTDQEIDSNVLQPDLAIIFQVGEIRGRVELTEEEQEQLMNLLATLMESESNAEKLDVGAKLNEMANLPPLFSEFAQLLSEVNSVLSQISSKQDAEKAAPTLLHFLQQWMSLDKKSGVEKSGDTVLNLMKKETSGLQGVWKELLQSFEKRNQMASKNQYNTDSKVTSSDVAKWVTNALAQQTEGTTKVEGAGQSSFTLTGPMSQTEQLVIHINSSHTAIKSPDKQLVEQFQQLIHSSKFAAKSNGTTQLSISLRPENLGDMMIKLTQINGEMTVKILVSSQATKEMMEGNIHQLRNMFSPNQVVIEKQDPTVQQTQNLQEDQDSQHSEQNQNRSSDTRQEEDDQPEDDFATQFHELIMNEKV